eukprot:403358018
MTSTNIKSKIVDIKQLREQQKKLLAKLKSFKLQKVIYWDYNPLINQDLEQSIPQPLMLTMRSLKQKIKYFKSAINSFSVALTESGEVHVWGSFNESFDINSTTSQIKIDTNSVWLTQESSLISFKQQIIKVDVTYSSILAIDGFGEFIMSQNDPRLLSRDVVELQTSLYSKFQNIENNKIRLFEDFIAVIDQEGKLFFSGSRFNQKLNYSQNYYQNNKSIQSASICMTQNNEEYEKMQNKGSKHLVNIEDQVEEIYASKDQILLKSKDSNKIYLLNEKMEVFSFDIPINYTILDIQSTHLSFLIIFKDQLNQLYLLDTCQQEPYIISQQPQNLRIIMISKEFNQGIVRFSSTQNMNGQSTMIYEETVDIDKINQDYLKLKKQIHNTSQMLYDLNFNYEAKRIGIYVDLGINLTFVKNLYKKQNKFYSSEENTGHQLSQSLQLSSNKNIDQSTQANFEVEYQNLNGNFSMQSISSISIDHKQCLEDRRILRDLTNKVNNTPFDSKSQCVNRY